MKENNLLIMKLVLNIAIIILELIGFIIIYNAIKFNLFIYYTELSNLLLLISSILESYKLIMMLRGKKIEECKLFNILRYLACLSVSVTLIVVLTILGPIYPTGYYGILFEGSMLYHHLLCPLICIFMFIFLEEYDFSKKDAIRAVYFTFVYAIILSILNILRIVDGPYPFLKVYDQSIFKTIGYFILIIGGAIGLSYLIRIGNKKLCIITKQGRKKSKES